MLVLSRDDVADLLGLHECIDAVEGAFRAYGEERCTAGVLGMHAEGGGFHIKAALMGGDAPRFAVKVNGNFFHNAERFGLPRIQGLIMLSDARNGVPLAVMDSTYITQLRTGAATAVAARYLARLNASVVTIVGCGLQGEIQLRALADVRPVTKAFAHDVDAERARIFARTMTDVIGCPVHAVDSVAAGSAQSDMIVTCTPARAPILFAADVRPGTFIAAVGADSEDKQEIDPALLARAAVFPDILEQAATIGDLHHAIQAGLMRREDARAELGDVVAGRAPGRLSESEIVVFDSTGTAIQDLAAATLVHVRALARRASSRPHALTSAVWNGPLFRLSM